MSGILKLNIDCFEEVFDYLQLKDLLSIAATCKRLNQVVAYIYQQNYSAAQLQCIFDSIWFRLWHCHCSNSFAQFVRKMRIFPIGDLETFRMLELKNLRQMELNIFHLTPEAIDCMKAILRNLEFLRLDSPEEFEGSFNEMIHNFCPNLKRLSLNSEVDDDEPDLIGIDDNWLLQNYPTLEHFELEAKNGYCIDNMATFFVLNPNIRYFSTTADYLWKNRNSFLKANIAFEDLTIKFWYNPTLDLMEFSHLLNELHRRNFFKRLKIYYEETFHKTVIEAVASSKALAKLYITNFNEISLSDVNDSALENIEELCVCVDELHDISSFVSVACNLENLKRIQLWNATFDHILSLASQAAKLRKINVKFKTHPDNGLLFARNKNAINLFKLNEEREKLARARKLIVYVVEDYYLRTKWAVRETDFNLIRLKRIDSDEWNHEFNYFWDSS